MIEQSLTFLGVVVVLTLTPGADMALVMRNVLAFGRPSLMPTIAGIFSGLAVHITSCVIGLSLVLARSDTAFTVVKVAGAAYLVWLGMQGLLASRRAAAGAQVEATAATADAERAPAQPAVTDAIPAMAVTPAVPFRQLYRQGFLGNLLNVKIALFYLSFLPQFAHPGPGFALRALGLAAVQMTIGFAWLLIYGQIIERAANRSRGGEASRSRLLLERFTGFALIAFGLRLALAVK
ncbi:MAG: LysE family translocator [Thermoleophilia bacterium]|nr:LysE family translocator [Thermoleophilia bacterium]